MTPEAQNLTQALAALEQLWVDHDIPMAHLALPGLSAQEVRDGVASVGLRAPDELITWFAWHNGYDMSSRLTYREAEFAPSGWCLLSLDRAINTYKGSREIWAPIPGEDDSAWAWTPEWFPIAESVGADTMVISCAGEPPSVAKVTVIGKEGRNESFDPVPSLFEAVKLLLRLAEAGEYRWGNPGWVGNQLALGDSPLF